MKQLRDDESGTTRKILGQAQEIAKLKKENEELKQQSQSKKEGEEIARLKRENEDLREANKEMTA